MAPSEAGDHPVPPSDRPRVAVNEDDRRSIPGADVEHVEVLAGKLHDAANPGLRLLGLGARDERVDGESDGHQGDEPQGELAPASSGPPTLHREKQ